ncbi:pyrroloquinoline quinone biosynthesis protein D [Streptoalloteichus tenebrarius]|uniref:Pyrroloquinoline quinone biosynthesis protein D n=1 Tax=Streptoalloteichus tenebrarius (strain ATCC 17920 / DSM 40477 / JCM 4838 / CBS 697.72 / NBRC 16177 / NCIMB 11028 / NRRL B-12390 / A12253. 1 / ISP 5477) TaxID=1933 RepID=A0ABT1HTZ8_STRSD|nr:pyrroloquinoline quinone biosynthesis peptide chaperone PqqD [Streptoalloteichus tenebrarius]MCP2258968.1 pyrroloquinoline quinone biosynthesis protein D [Streptoalloteichus tenebrarius]BFF01177.1 hypothetical protein GCM10020241_28520 [Streptoalloteichus tenebrarius]
MTVPDSHPEKRAFPLPDTAVPRLRRGVRLSFDPTRDSYVLLYPEGVLLPNETAAAVLGRCDGGADVATIVASLARDFDGVDAAQVSDLLRRLERRRLVEIVERPDGTVRDDG